MSWKITMLSVVCAGLLGVPVPVSAQMDNSSVEEPVKLEALFDPNEGSGELRAVKEKIQALLLENEELASQARSLKRESLDLQEKAARFHAATGAAGTAPAGNQEWPEQNVENVAKPGQPPRPPLAWRAFLCSTTTATPQSTSTLRKSGRRMIRKSPRCKKNLNRIPSRKNSWPAKRGNSRSKTSGTAMNWNA